jgi:hypothetical protein
MLQFWFVILATKYLNFAPYSFSTFISPHQRQMRLLCISLQYLCFLKPEINNIGTEKKLMWPTQFQSLLIDMDLPNSNAFYYKIKTLINKYECVSPSMNATMGYHCHLVFMQTAPQK